MISIDFATTADIPSVQKLQTQTLGPSFMESASSKLRAQCAADQVMHLVAREEGRVVGSVQLRRIQLAGVGCDSSHKASFLGPLVTHRFYQGMGLGSKLMDYSLSLLQKKDYSLVFLVGDNDYYSRFGFRSVHPHNISLPDDQDRDRLCVKMLGRPCVLPVYARLKPYNEPQSTCFVDDSMGISNVVEEQAWREHIA